MLSVVLKIGKKMKFLIINICNLLIFIFLEIFYVLIIIFKEWVSSCMNFKRMKIIKLWFKKKKLFIGYFLGNEIVIDRLKK